MKAIKRLPVELNPIIIESILGSFTSRGGPGPVRMLRTPETDTGALSSSCSPAVLCPVTDHRDFGVPGPEAWGEGGLVFLLPKLNPWVCRVSPLFLFCDNALVYPTCPTF